MPYEYPGVNEKNLNSYLYRLVEKMNENEQLQQKKIDELQNRIAELEGRK